MKFLLEIDCDNAAFEFGGQGEVARILKEASLSLQNRGCLEDMARFGSTIVLRDYNGNNVGNAKVVA